MPLCDPSLIREMRGKGCHFNLFSPLLVQAANGPSLIICVINAHTLYPDLTPGFTLYVKNATHG